ncbi:hypothetical protein F5146DRAFT_217872 [Armillaria mellea]|nr:hypothetical protein F5146DRAFT_217872 [Armillaria mellea]
MGARQLLGILLYCCIQRYLYICMAWTILSAHILSQRSTCRINEVNSYIWNLPATYLLMSHYPYHQELTACGDPIQEPRAVTDGVAQVTPSAYGLQVPSFQSERKVL